MPVSAPARAIATLTRLALAGSLAAVLAACSMGGQPLSPGLSAPMNQPGAQLSRVEALFLLNDYRRTQTAGDVRGDAVLDDRAQTLATAYAKTGTPPVMPAGVTIMRVSAGYNTFAEAFSSWRNAPADAAAIADRSATRAGLGVAYQANSANGVYWVLLLAP